MPWYGYLLVLLALAVPLAYMWMQAAREDRVLARAGLSRARQMPWPEFLRYLGALFEGLGYQVERIPVRSDYGADLIIKDGTGRRTAVNARHFKERILPGVLEEVAAGAQYHDCQDALVISIAGFSNKAIDASEETGTILWDAGDLAENMEKVRARPSFQARETARSPLPAPPVAATRETAPAAEPTGPACPVCGKPMEPKIAAGREIWLCSRFPRCNGAQLRDLK